MGPAYMCVSELRREQGMIETREVGPNSWRNTFVCIFLGKCARSVSCAGVGKPEENIVGPLPWRPNSRQPLDNEPWAQQVWCGTIAHFRGNIELTHHLLSAPRGARDFAKILNEELVSHDSGATRQIGVRTRKQMCDCVAVACRSSVDFGRTSGPKTALRSRSFRWLNEHRVSRMNRCVCIQNMCLCSVVFHQHRVF